MGSISKYLAAASLPNLGSLKVSSLGNEVMFGLLALVVVLLFALSLGRTRVLLSLLAIYIAFTLQAVFPFFGQLQNSVSFTHDLGTLRVVVFLALYVIALLILNGSVLRHRFTLAEAAFTPVILMGLVQLGLIVSIILNLAPDFYGIVGRMPSASIPYLATQRALFVWSLVPLALILFTKRGSN